MATIETGLRIAGERIAAAEAEITPVDLAQMPREVAHKVIKLKSSCQVIVALARQVRESTT